MFPGTLSKDNVDGRHYNSNIISTLLLFLKPLYLLTSVWPLEMSGQSTEREQIYLSGCYF